MLDDELLLEELLDEDELLEELLEDEGSLVPCPPQATRLAINVAR